MINTAIFGVYTLPLLLHLIQQDFPTGVTIIDNRGDLARAVLDIIPIELTEKAFYFDPANHPASFNVFENVTDKSKLVQDLCAFFDAQFPAGENTLTQGNARFVLANVLTIISDNPRATFMSVLDFLSDTDFQTQCLSDCTNEMALRNWAAIEEWDTSQRKNAFAQIETKLGTLLLSPVMHDTLQKKCTHFFEHNEILIADLSRSKIGDQASKLLGTLLISRAKTPVYINDFDFYASDYIASLFSQGGYTVATQFLSTLPPNVAQIVQGFDQKYVFRTTPADAEELKFDLGVQNIRAITDQLPGEFLPDLDLEAPRTTGRSAAVLRRSVACYTRPKD
jgi:hypothetical protein